MSKQKQQALWVKAPIGPPTTIGNEVVQFARYIEVERCRHGNIDGHAYRTDHRDPTHTAWCFGSPTLATGWPHE